MTTAPVRFGRYTIVDVLGEGGFATVFRAWDPALSRDVAIKALLPHMATDPDVRRRFVDEARALAALRHPNIVSVHDVGEADGRPFFAMDVVRGQTLAAALQHGGAPSFDQVLAIVQQLADALDTLHGAGLVHRDVKPANVMIEPDGRIVLMDLGVARSLAAERHTQTGASLGTPTYMAPEQVRGQPAGPTADVYALGILTYYLLAGRPPFEGDTAYVLHAQAFEPPPPLEHLRPGLPPAAYPAVRAALAKDPSHRPPSAGAFAAALAGHMPSPAAYTHQPPGAVAGDVTQRSWESPPLGVFPAGDVRQRTHRAGPSMGVIFAGTAIVIAGLALGVLSVLATHGRGGGVAGSAATGTLTPVAAVVSTTISSATGTPLPAAAQSALQTATVASQRSPTPAPPVAAPTPSFGPLMVRNADTWGAGDGSLQGCYHFEQATPGAVMRLRVTPAADPGSPVVDDVTAPLTAAAGDTCNEIPSHGQMPAGNYLALLFDQGWVQRSSYQFNVAARTPPTQPPAPTAIRATDQATPPHLPAPPPRTAAGPAPYVEFVDAPSPARRGQPFDFTVIAHNAGSGSGAGSLTVSSPDQPGLSVSDYTCNGLGKAVALTAGDSITVFNTTPPHREPASDPLVEVDFDRLPADGSCSLTVHAGALNGSAATFYLRVTAFLAGTSGPIISWPSQGQSSDKDQQQLPVARWSIPVAP